MSQVPCTGPGCPLCELVGSPKMVMVPVKDLKDDKWKWLTISREKALELGMIKEKG